MNILVIDDEPLILESITRILRKIPQIHIIETAKDFQSAYNKVKSCVFDIVLTDIFLGEDFTGIDLCAAIRKDNLEIPLIIVTTIHSTKYLEYAFNVGANDYITKPFQPKELELRVKRWLLLSHKIKFQQNIFYNGLLYDIQKNEFFFEKKYISLPKKQKFLLLLFLKQPEKVLSENFLQEKIWGDYEDFHHHNIRSNIQLLRKSLKEKNRIENWIQNKRGEGYFLKIS